MKYLIFFTIFLFGFSSQNEYVYRVKQINIYEDFRVVIAENNKEPRTLICTNTSLIIQTGKCYSIYTLDKYEYYKEAYNIEFSISDVGLSSWTSESGITIKSENGSEILFIKSLKQR